MTRLIYLSDSHLGGTLEGYHQQMRYAEREGEIVAALQRFIDAQADTAPIDLVLHGGDIIDATSDDAIRAAANLFNLSVTVHLCLGNHDITTRDAVSRWLALAPQLFPDGRPEFTLRFDDCVIHVAPNHWGLEPYVWDSEQSPRFDESQLAMLAAAMDRDTDRPHVLLTHSPVMGMPEAQSGEAGPLHGSSDAFLAQVRSLVEPREHVRLVLGAHSHMNTCVEGGGVRYVTSSSLIETPFEFKVMELSRSALTMRTHSLDGAMAFRATYDFDRTHVQGRACDRGFEIEW